MLLFAIGFLTCLSLILVICFICFIWNGDDDD